MSDPSPLAARRGFITLDAEAWAAIRSEYLAGATAKQISQKWGCSVVSVYDHASKGGYTKKARGQAISLTVLEETRAERAVVAARACEPPLEADPLLASRMLLRQAAAAALLGRGQEAFEGVRMAESLARCARLLGDAEYGIAEERGKLLAEAKQALEDDPDYQPASERNREEAQALREEIARKFAELRKARGRAPPQRLPLWFLLEERPTSRPLAEALGLVVEGRAWVECPDFEAAVETARAQGRGEAIDAALSTPIPIELCTWLSEEEKAALLEREQRATRLADAAAAEVASGLGWEGDEVVEAGDVSEPDEERDHGPALTRLDESSMPWAAKPGPPHRLSGPLRFIS